MLADDENHSPAPLDSRYDALFNRASNLEVSFVDAESHLFDFSVCSRRVCLQMSYQLFYDPVSVSTIVNQKGVIVVYPLPIEKDLVSSTLVGQLQQVVSDVSAASVEEHRHDGAQQCQSQQSGRQLQRQRFGTFEIQVSDDQIFKIRESHIVPIIETSVDVKI